MTSKSISEELKIWTGLNKLQILVLENFEQFLIKCLWSHFIQTNLFHFKGRAKDSKKPILYPTEL